MSHCRMFYREKGEGRTDFSFERNSYNSEYYLDIKNRHIVNQNRPTSKAVDITKSELT